LDFIGSYPEPDSVSVEVRIAEWKGIDPGQVMVAAGVTDVIYQIAQSYAGGNSLILTPSFREYEDACVMFGHRIGFFSDIDEIVCHGGRHDLVWVCNPNNPTGGVFDPKELIDLAGSMPDTVFVVDQAYEDYTSASVIGLGEGLRYPNLILLHSITKRFSAPGLRIGYATAKASLLDRIRRCRKPWTVSQLSVDAIYFLIANEYLYALPCERLVEQASELRTQLRVLGVECMESSTNFFLCRLPHGSAAALKEYLVSNYGILIRDASNFRGLDSRCFRIAAQLPEENGLLVKAIEEWMES